MPQCWIGLGGNQGDVPAAFKVIERRLAAELKAGHLTVSPLFRTAPIGTNAGATFWNAVAGFDTTLEPLPLLDRLQAWEAEFGRVRTVRWGPRPLDLDLLFYDRLVEDSPRLTLPHPGAWYRRFVLEPLCGVAPNLVHPVWSLTIRHLRDRLAQAPATVFLWSPLRDDAHTWRDRLQSKCPDIAVRTNDGQSPAPHGLMIALGAIVPDSWQSTPHLRFALQQPPEQLEQSLVDACAAAFDVPLCVE